MLCFQDGDSRFEALDIWLLYSDVFYALGIEIVMEPITPDALMMTPHVLFEMNSQMFAENNSYRIGVSEKQVRLRTSSVTMTITQLCMPKILNSFCFQVKIQSSDFEATHNAIRTFLQLLRFSDEAGICPVQVSTVKT